MAAAKCLLAPDSFQKLMLKVGLKVRHLGSGMDVFYLDESHLDVREVETNLWSGCYLELI